MAKEASLGTISGEYIEHWYKTPHESNVQQLLVWVHWLDTHLDYMIGIYFVIFMFPYMELNMECLNFHFL